MCLLPMPDLLQQLWLKEKENTHIHTLFSTKREDRSLCVWLSPRKWQECGGAVSEREVSSQTAIRKLPNERLFIHHLIYVHTTHINCMQSVSNYTHTHNPTLSCSTGPTAVTLKDIKEPHSPSHDCQAVVMTYSPAGWAECRGADGRAQLPAVPKPHLPTTHLQNKRNQCEHHRWNRKVALNRQKASASRFQRNFSFFWIDIYVSNQFFSASLICH